MFNTKRYEQYFKDREDLFRKLSSNPEHVIPVYYCPICQRNVNIMDTDHLITGVSPRCEVCGNLVQWNYKALR